MKKVIAFTLPAPNHCKDGGSHNGYVAIPALHPCFGVDFMDYESPVVPDLNGNYNGGVTYCHSEIKGQPEETKGMWIVGFDTQHSWDTPDSWTEESVLALAEKLAEELQDTKPIKLAYSDDATEAQLGVTITGVVALCDAAIDDPSLITKEWLQGIRRYASSGLQEATE